MAKKETERTVEVTLDIDNPDDKITIIVKKQSNRVQTEAARIGALVWTQCIKDGVMTKLELEKFMKKKGIWGDEKEKEKDQVATEIANLEKELYLGNSNSGSTKKGGRKKRMNISDAKELALEMRRKRARLRDLLAEKINLETNTAESLSENAKFDFIVASCTFDQDGNQFYGSVEEYEKKSEDAVAFEAASTLAELMYAINKDFEAKLPENKFLSRFGMVNEDLSLVNKQGQTVDTKGNLINDQGQYLDGDGKRIDINGNSLDEDGNYEFGVEFFDEDGNTVFETSEEESSEVESPEVESESLLDKDQSTLEEKSQTIDTTEK